MAREIDMRNDDASGRRLFVDADIGGERLTIGERTAHYIGRVLRLRPGDAVIVFDGRGRERRATIERLEKKRAELELGTGIEPLPEPATSLTLVQALVKADAMDAIVQKATELGVGAIRPVRTDFSVVKLDAERAGRRVEHWSRVARSACEQSGRHSPPAVHTPARLDDVLPALSEHDRRIAFQPDAAPLARCETRPVSRVCLLLGPEGGFSAAELEAVEAAGFARFRLGPRILRADTAAVAACTLAQTFWGDLG